MHMTQIKKPWRDEVANDLQSYGYDLTADDRIVLKNGTESSITVEELRGRIRTRRPDGSLLWSGPRITNFLESFWFAKPIR